MGEFAAILYPREYNTAYVAGEAGAADFFNSEEDGEVARRFMSEDFLFVGPPKSCDCSVRKWRSLASENTLWSNLFTERWGTDGATFYAPVDSKTWKDVYVVQDRCDRVGLGLKIIREGDDYYLVHQGEIQRYLGRRQPETGEIDPSAGASRSNDCSVGDESGSGILDKILFFLGDMETASLHAKRSRICE